jgi:TolA-binding protein
MKRVVLLLALSAGGCSIQDLEQKVSRLERSLNDMRAYQAEQTETINSLDTQLKQMSGRIEEVEFSHNKRIGTDLSALKDDLSSLRRRVPPPSVVPAAELEVDEVWASSLTGEPQVLVTDALLRLREGKFDDALPLLQNAVSQLRGTDKAAVALFWQGVAYDGLGDDRSALRSYADAVYQYPKSQRASSSLLRQASVLTRLGDNKTAALSLRKLVDDYPRSPEASVAKERLRDLK